METIGVISISIIGIFIVLSSKQRRNVLIFFGFIFFVNFCNLSNEDEKKPNQKSVEVNNSKKFKKKRERLQPIQNNFYNNNNNQTIYSSKPKKKYQTKNKRLVKVGAECYDGTFSNSTGRGTCSYHGGVKDWIYEEEYY
jgi:hypothetical protein